MEKGRNISESASINSSEINSSSTESEDKTPAPKDSGIKFNLPKIIRGYSGLIPTKFRALTIGEQEKLKLVIISDLLTEIEDSIIIEPRKFVQLAKSCIAQKTPATLVKLVFLLDKFPQFIPYILDIIKKMRMIFQIRSYLK